MVAPYFHRMYDLAIKGGEVVTPEFRRGLNVYITGEKIAAVTSDDRPSRESVDASGLLVMPGMVDAHVHFMDPGDPSREDFPTGTAAAVRAGVTSVIEHTHAAPVISAKDLTEKVDYLRTRARVDFGLGAHAWPDRLEEIPGVWLAGVAFVKAFTCATHGVPGFDAAHLHSLFLEIKRANAVCLVHCEDESLTSEAERALHSVGRDDGSVIPTWRNPEAELTALATARVLAKATGARVVAAHVSQIAALEVAQGLAVETCPQYLTLRADEVLEYGAFRKFTPPARPDRPRILTLCGRRSATVRSTTCQAIMLPRPSSRRERAQSGTSILGFRASTRRFRSCSMVRTKDSSRTSV